MNQRDDRTFLEPQRMQEVLRRRLTRRSLLKGAGTGAAALGLGGLLAACGGGTSGGGGTNGGGGSTSSAFDVSQIYSGDPGSSINFANWPLYIDHAKDKNGNRYIPSLRNFTKETGIDVSYQEVIQDNTDFFGKLQPQLQAGDDTGWDIIVITNGREFTALTKLDWVYPLDPGKRPNFDANAAAWAKNPPYDPDNTHGMAWQSGITGIGVNDKLVKGSVTKLDDLANPDIVGVGKVGMLKNDMQDFVMINLGIDPTTSGPDEWKEAADWLRKQRDTGVVRQYYDQGYVDDLTAGNLSATMAWSGDVLYYKLWAGYDNLDFVFPDGGALLWIDNMMIPAHANNPVGAMELMDYYYKPEVATGVTEWVLYMSPVPATRDLIMKDSQAARDEGSKGYANKLEATANSPYLYPDDAFLARTKFGRDLKTDEERQEWDSIFLPITQA
ncbi:MAG TPA: spermidine/putrescine ABC transporter substrate-binding protein [Actinomycetota bacterium]|jgi:spermidine/putrescine transport system substrate-binding protein|nr:spermidine/putrescine ABC transporter substrate-binding protein [Actinomycetota bacterium]